jgi:DNA-binding transcriptional LysR family regulator
MPLRSPLARPFATSRVNLDIALLRTFVAVTELGSVARAAERVHRSQPATSLQIKRLEEIVGTSLFRKAGRGLALTEHGDTLLDHARRLLELNDETVAVATTLRLSGSVRLGIAQDFIPVLTHVLARFSRCHPSVVVEVKSDRNAVLKEALAHKQLDFILSFGDGATRDVTVIGKTPMVWIGAAHQRPAIQDPVPLVVFEPPCEFRKIALCALDQVGVGHRTAFSSPSLLSQWAAIEAGMGVGARTAIGLSPALSVLGKKQGLPLLPTIDVCIKTKGSKPDAPVLKLREIVFDTMAEHLSALAGATRLQF